MPIFLPRVFAFTIDALIGAIPAFMMFPVALTMMLSDSAQNQFVGRYLLVLSVPPAFLFFLFIALVQAVRGEQTVGRRLAGIELVRKDGSKTGFFNALIRVTAVAVVPLMVFLFGLSPLLLLLPACGAFLDKQGRAPWDLMAGTEIKPVQSSALEAARQR